jgi:acetylornithine deacetylase/succinyl-diaminopimelate desuccinylase-like protein
MATAQGKPQGISPELANRIIAEVREDELVQMCCEVIEIPSPTGEELKMAEYMRSALEALGLNVTWQDVEEGRANVVARWDGAGDGPNLMFNGHMDTSNTGTESFLTGLGYKPHAVVKNGFIYGLGIYNMKGALCCYTHAVRALQRAGVRLLGDVIVGAVAGEIEKAQWGEYTGRQYRGYGAGTHYLVSHGVLPDMCILGEPTDMKLVLEHSGSLWVRISTRGIYVHTAFAEGRQGHNALHRMHDVMDEILRWADVWCKKTAFGGHQGVVNLGCLQAGAPWRASRTPPQADLFLDIRVPPSMPMNEARREVKRLVGELKKRWPDYGIDFETYVSVPGATIEENHVMVQAIEANHTRLIGRAPERDTVLWCSDASVMSRFGIPTVNYGPSSGPRDAEGEKVAIKTLVEVTRVYALTAAQICGVAART